MLTHAEQRLLKDIESQLHADDPDFVRRFESGRRHEPRRSRLVMAIATAVALALILFISHGIAGVLLVVFIGLLVANRLAYRYLRTRVPGHYERHGNHMD
jgi:Flp pilus assembly protein TadB